MQNFVIGRPSEVPHYELKQLPDGRWHLEHYTKIGSNSLVTSSLFEKKGTLYRGDTSAGTNVEAFAGLRLVDIYVQRVRLDGGQEECIVRVYEQIPEAAEVIAGKPKILRGDDGRITAVVDSLQFSAANPTPQRVGATACPVWPVAMTATGTNGSASLACAKHGLLAGDAVVFSAIVGVGGPILAGLVTGTTYYVVASGLTADAFQLSATVGGAAIVLTGNVTGATFTLAVTTILENEETSDDGSIRSIKRSYINKGVISIRRRGISGGLIEVEMVSVAVRENPPGIVVHVDTQNPGGVPVFTVTAFQLKDGTTVTDGAIAEAKSAWLEFPYPGRAKVYKMTVAAGAGGVSLTYLEVFMSPPLQVKVLGTIQTIYTTSNQAGLLAYPLWNPTSWATLIASWVGWNNVPRSEIKTLPNYRVDGAGTSASDTVTGGTDGLSASCLGDRVYAGTVATVSLVGGPENPVGKTYTLVEKIEEAFIAEDGTQWYRKEVGFAGIPAQPAVPVDSTPVLPTTIATAAQLAAITSAGVPVGTVTNAFTVTWTQGSATFTRSVKATLISDPTNLHVSTTIPLWVTPTDYLTSLLYWVLTPA